MEEDEEIIFEGSALHGHLKSLNLIQVNEDHPSLASHKACAPQLLQFDRPSSYNLSQEVRRESWWEQIKSGLYTTSIELKRIKRKFLLLDQLENEVLSFLALLVCSKGLLTPDDRLHLYYFSPIFNNLVEEPALINAINEQESIASSTLLPSPSVKKWIPALGAIVAAASALCGGSGSALSKTVEDFKDSCYQVTATTSVVWAPLLALLLVCKTARMVTRHRYISAYWQTKEAIMSLASLQSSCLPPAFSAAADAALLVSPSTASDSALCKRLSCELTHLHRLLHDTLSCAVAATAPPAASLHQIEADDWTRTKAMRRDLELQISALSRDILLKAEKSCTRKRLSNSTCWTHVHGGDGSILHVMETLYASLAEALPDIQVLSDAVTCQVGLLRHCWLYSEKDLKPRQERIPEEVSSAASLIRHMQACLLVLDQIDPDLKEFSSIPLPDSNETLEDESREIVFWKYGNIQDKLANLREEFRLCQHDLEVLTESLAMRKLRLFREPGVSSCLNTEVRFTENVAENSELPSTIPELHVIPVTPYIAEDEFFEATTEDRGDNVEETAKWDAENEQDEQIRRQVIACNKRVLSELQPILVRKKEEFKQREEKAKKRMRGDGASENCCPDDEGDKVKVPALSNEDGIINDKILNVVDASSALRAAEHPPFPQHSDATFTLPHRFLTSAENCIRPSRNSNRNDKLQNSPGESQLRPENSSHESQFRSENSSGECLPSPVRDASCFVVKPSSSDPEDQAPLTECSEHPPGRLALHGHIRELPCVEDTNHGLETNLDDDVSSSKSSSNNVHTPATLDSDVHDESPLSDANFCVNESLLKDSDHPNYHEYRDGYNKLECKTTIFETAACDSGARVPRSPEYVVSHEEFESLPDQNNDGHSRWNIRVRPRDLKERLQLMMENQRRELSNSDEISDEQVDFLRSSDERSWGFPSHLAAEAVRLSGKFGVREETLGGMGECEEEVFGGMGEWGDRRSDDSGEEETLSDNGDQDKVNIQYDRNDEGAVDGVVDRILANNNAVNSDVENIEGVSSTGDENNMRILQSNGL